MEDVKVTYTVNGKEFDDYDKAMEYKAEREKNNADKAELEKLIIDGHEALSQLLERYNALNPTKAENRNYVQRLAYLTQSNVSMLNQSSIPAGKMN